MAVTPGMKGEAMSPLHHKYKKEGNLMGIWSICGSIQLPSLTVRGVLIFNSKPARQNVQKVYVQARWFAGGPVFITLNSASEDSNVAFDIHVKNPQRNNNASRILLGALLTGCNGLCDWKWLNLASTLYSLFMSPHNVTQALHTYSPSSSFVLFCCPF